MKRICFKFLKNEWNKELKVLKEYQFFLILILILFPIFIFFVGCDMFLSESEENERFIQKVHIFYYPWYRNPQTDECWKHWDQNNHNPPDDIASNFYPVLGAYSNNDPETIDKHMQWIKNSNVGVIIISWWGQKSWEEDPVPLILEKAKKYGLKVGWHIEPYLGRTAASVKKDIEYIINTYGSSPAFYRDVNHGNKPIFYIYDSYRISENDWATVLSPAGTDTIRGTQYDSIVIALFVNSDDTSFVLNGYFDGFYTYFATDGFTYGSTPSNWASMAQWARDNNKIFIPSVGPGYDDTRVRPWNSINRRDRENGAYYDRMFQAAININPDIISITSFNEWHEGTQIEPADPNKVSPDGYDYIDYQPYPDTFYLYKTLYWSNTYIKNSSHLKGLTIKEKFMPSVGSVMPKNTSIYRCPFKNILYTWNANYVGLKP